MSSADIYTTATQGAVLALGRAPKWSTQSDSGSTEPPASAASGVAMEDAVRCLLDVKLREDAHHRTVRLGTTAVLTGTYTVTIDGTAVAYDADAGAPADLAALVTAIAAAINADGTAGALVTATAVDVDDTTTGALVKVLVEGDGEDDYSIDFAHSGTGSPTLTCVADYCTATLRPWWALDARSGSTAPTGWRWGLDSYDVDRRGFLQRFDVGGLSRAFAQLSDRRGHAADGVSVTYTTPTISIGPCLSEV